MDGRADVTVDVVIVGGGIAGAALATVLARDGFDVLVLERQTSLPGQGPRRGRCCCWGVAEMLAAGPGEAAARRGRPLRHPGRAVRRAGGPRDRPRRTRRRWTGCCPACPARWTSDTRRRARRWPRAAAAAGATVSCAASATSRSSRASGRPVATSSTTWCTRCLPAGGRRRRADVERAPRGRPRRCRHSEPRTMGGRHARRRAATAGPPTSVAGHRGRPLLPRVPAGQRPRPALPAARPRPARPVRRPGPRASVPGRVPAVRLHPRQRRMFAAARPAGPCAFYPMNDSWTDGPCAPGRGAGRRRRRLERPDHRAGPVDRAARRADGRRHPAAPSPDRPTAAFAPYVAGAAGADAAAAGGRAGPDRPRRHVHPGRRRPPEGLQRGLPRRPGARRAAPGLAARTGQRPRRGVRPDNVERILAMG